MHKLLNPLDLGGGQRTCVIRAIDKTPNGTFAVTDAGSFEIDGRLLGLLAPTLGHDLTYWAGRSVTVEADATLPGGLHVTVVPEGRARSEHPGIYFDDGSAREQAMARLPGYTAPGSWMSGGFPK